MVESLYYRWMDVKRNWTQARLAPAVAAAEPEEL